MAQYDVAPLIYSGVASTSGTTYTNSDVGTAKSIKTIKLKLQESNTTTPRKIIVYVNGTGVTNEVNKFILNPSTSWAYSWDDVGIILNSSQTITFTSDSGTDVNIFIYGSSTVL